MNQTAIFWPMLTQILLVFIVYLVLLARRAGAIRSGEAKAGHFRGRLNEPASSANTANNILNQFELPVLFYAACICLYVTQGSNLLTLMLAWIFAVLRYAHAYVHLTGNDLRARMLLFSCGVVVLAALWILFALHIAGL